MFRQSVKTFMAVVEKGSISKAANSLFLSPPAVKRQIDQLEEELGIKLLKRTSRGTKLTRAGESLYQELTFVTEYVDHAVEVAKHIAEDNHYQIRIGTSLLSPCDPLLEIWKRIGEKYPQFKLSIVSFNDDVESMKKNFRTIGMEFDIMVRICDVTNWKDSFQFLELRKSPVCIYVPKSHELLSKRKLTVHDLYGERIAIIKEGTSAIIDDINRHLRANHPQVNVESKVPHYDIELFNQCALENLPLIAPNAWDGAHPHMTAVPVDWDFTMPFGITYPLHPRKEIGEFVEAIKTYIESGAFDR